MNECMSAFPGMSPGELSPGLAQLKGEHAPLREKLTGLFSLTEKIENEIEIEQIFIDLAELVKNAHNILTEHFTKEENVLFPMAERMLSDEEKEELHRRIQEI